MSIELYRDGVTHVINGVHCEMALFEPCEMDGALQRGWRKWPEPPKEETTSDLLDKLSNEEVRAFAKEEGIEGYTSSRIETLKKKLIKKADDEQQPD